MAKPKTLADFTGLSVEEAQTALGITFTKAQRETFEANLRLAMESEAKQAAIKAIDATVRTEQDSEEFYSMLCDWAETFNGAVTRTVERQQGRGNISEKVLTVPVPGGKFKVQFTLA
jgi:rubrerythrin